MSSRLKRLFFITKTILTYYALANLKLTGTDAKGAYFLQFIQYVQKMQQKDFYQRTFINNYDI